MTTTNSIYKINYLIDKDTIKAIYVFFGNHLDVQSPTELFKRDPRNVAFINKETGLPIFTEKEITAILRPEAPIDVYFSDQQIHFDDSIGTIKLKIVSEFSNTFSLEEIYLFCIKEETFNSTSVYETLTQNNRLDITKPRLNQFLLNIQSQGNGEPVKFTMIY